jgi:hypothetical protein
MEAVVRKQDGTVLSVTPGHAPTTPDIIVS